MADTTLTSPGPLPHWDVSGVYPSLESRELAVAHEGVVADLARLVALYDRHDVRAGEPRDGGPTDADVAAFDEVLTETNRLLDEVRVVSAYLYAFISTDSSNDVAAGLRSRLQAELTDLTRLTKRFEGWIARLGPAELVAASAAAAEHAYPLERAARAAEHQMSEAEEGLAADLRLTGSVAWARLHGEITSRLTAQVADGRGGVEALPMSVVRGLAHHPDADRRRAAHEAELAAWDTVTVPLAAALNGAKGETIVLNRRRGWGDALEPALFTNGVDRATLDAMHEAVVDSLPDFHRYLRAKATVLGHAPGRGLPWFDLFAPVGDAAAGRVSWTDAVSRVSDAFGGYSPALAALVERASRDEWIDAEPRAGKQGGAFCLPIQGGESRVMLNFDGSADSVQTLAHELGHAYHNTNLGERTPMQRQTPMALAETASIFCETIMVEAGLAATPPEQRLGLLDTDLQGSCQVVVDIHSRFLFERELCTRREQQDLSVAQLDDLMLASQRTAYGDGLDPDVLHPRMWAVKGHYFTPFYNWPYTFGLLFGIGLYARYLDDPDRFRSGYDDLLSSTGLADAAGLASRFGIDVRSTGFWASSLDVLRARIDAFEHLAAAAAGSAIPSP
ncbi:MAG: M3 family oligoendopeptidase [Acidimicrobiales bacterium]